MKSKIRCVISTSCRIARERQEWIALSSMFEGSGGAQAQWWSIASHVGKQCYSTQSRGNCHSITARLGGISSQSTAQIQPMLPATLASGRNVVSKRVCRFANEE